MLIYLTTLFDQIIKDSHFTGVGTYLIVAAPVLHKRKFFLRPSKIHFRAHPYSKGHIYSLQMSASVYLSDQLLLPVKTLF